MRGLLSSIVGKIVGTMSGAFGGELERFFAALDKADPGLARKVAHYVSSGEGGSVLATLGTPAAAAAWRDQAYTYRRSTPATALLGADADAQLVRYGEALALLAPLPANSHWGAFGTKIAPDWLRLAISSDHGNGRGNALCGIARIQRLAEQGGASTPAILDILTHPGPGVPYGTQHSFDRFSGAAAWLADNAAAVIAGQAGLDAPGRVELAQAIGRFSLTGPYLGLLIDYGLSSAKTVRAAATKALTAAPRDRLADALAERWPAASPGTRAELVTLALAALGTDAGPLLARWQADETDKRPREALERALANVALTGESAPDAGASDGAYVALDGSTVELPPHGPPPGPGRIPDAVHDLLRPSIQSYNAKLLALREANKAEKNHWSRHHAPINDADIAAFRRDAESTAGIDRSNYQRRGIAALQWGESFIKFDTAGVSAFYAHPAVTVRHLLAIVRHDAHWGLLAFFGDHFAHAAARAFRERMKTPEDMLAAIDMWVAMGGKAPALDYLQVQWQASLATIDPAIFWPHVAESFDLIDEALGLRPQTHQPALHASNALDLLALLPKVPQRYLLPLMTIATGTQKAQRLQARALLAGAATIDAAIAGLLGDGRQETRAGGADWLAARGTRSAIPALRKALGKEKSDVARAAIITALERLGDDVSDCFDTAGLLAEAEAGLAKTSAKGLEWFPFDHLPRLAWREGTAIDPRIVRWWVVLANKLKQPGGNALLDLWLDRITPDGARQLSLFVLRSWIGHDTHRPDDAEGNAYALAHVDATLQSNRQAVKRYPQSAAYYVTDYDMLFTMLKRTRMNEYLGSATDSKGILALAGRAEGADAAGAMRAFLKDHGARVSQAKALLEVLAANPAAAAIQVVLATANRFKARTVQDHAAMLIDRIAERRGWTPDELADRTIPTAGLDERGEAEIDCGGGRIWRLRLDEQDALVLLNPSGQPAKALPAARNDEEQPLVAAARKQLATARKEHKQAQAAQTERLYEAMCIERRWGVEDWDAYLLRHPIVGRLLRRLVWIGLDADGGRVTLFRPLDDGSLSDVEDGTVDPASIAQVQIAHASLVTAGEAAAWRAHLADYEVDSPFAQFDTDLPVLPAADADRTAIVDRVGWMIETFKLRGTATKLGFVRGAAEDGGVFMTYERRYGAAGLIALIEFTGSPLPEENIPAALQALRFARLRRGTNWHGAGVALKEVPPVMLAESWKTLHLIAAAGTGFDPDWQKKAGW